MIFCLVIATFFHAYPIEWMQFATAFTAIGVHGHAIYDDYTAYSNIRRRYSKRHDLIDMAFSDLEQSTWRFIQQFLLVIVGIVAVKFAPPPADSYGLLVGSHPFDIEFQVTIMRTCLIANSIVSIIKQTRAIIIRQRIIRGWTVKKTRVVI